MAKTIKFNLICDGKPIRTIEDLQNNFSIEDVLKYYDNQLLHRWLSVRGFEEEHKKVLAIDAKDQMDIAKELIAIFGVKADMVSVEESVYMLQYLEERKKLYEYFGQKRKVSQNAISGYKEGYETLVKEIIEKPRDIAKIKANISAMVTDYSWIIKLNHRELFYMLTEQKACIAIMCLLMNEKTRGYYIPMKAEDGEEVSSLEEEEKSAQGYVIKSQQEMYEKICAMVISSEFDVAMEEYLLTFEGQTESYWKDIEPTGKKCMIISMSSSSHIRSAGKRGEELVYRDIYNKFMILDGIDYMSHSGKLVYMEV